MKKTESTLSCVQTENDGMVFILFLSLNFIAQKSEIISLRVKCDQLQAEISQLIAKRDNMESMLAAEHSKASSLESECSAQKEKVVSCRGKVDIFPFVEYFSHILSVFFARKKYRRTFREK